MPSFIHSFNYDVRQAFYYYYYDVGPGTSYRATHLFATNPGHRSHGIPQGVLQGVPQGVCTHGGHPPLCPLQGFAVLGSTVCMYFWELGAVRGCEHVVVSGSVSLGFRGLSGGGGLGFRGSSAPGAGGWGLGFRGLNGLATVGPSAPRLLPGRAGGAPRGGVRGRWRLGPPSTGFGARHLGLEVEGRQRPGGSPPPPRGLGPWGSGLRAVVDRALLYINKSPTVCPRRPSSVH